MFRRDAYTPLAQLLNPKLRYVGNDKSLLAFYDFYALVIHNIKLSIAKQADKFLIYTILEFNVEDKVLVRNYTRDL